MQIEEIVLKVVEALENQGVGIVCEERKIPVEISARHAHLSQKDVEILFGNGAMLTPDRPLSQTGQFLCKERVRLVGKKGVIENVAVLGPARKQSQVEISATDARALGIVPVLRESGKVSDSSAIVLMNGTNIVELSEGCIVAKNHIHMNPDDAKRLAVKDKQIVDVKIKSQRPLTFENVVIRVDPSFVLNMHIDFDEANATLLDKDSYGIIIDKG